MLSVVAIYVTYSLFFFFTHPYPFPYPIRYSFLLFLSPLLPPLLPPFPLDTGGPPLIAVAAGATKVAATPGQGHARGQGRPISAAREGQGRDPGQGRPTAVGGGPATVTTAKITQIDNRREQKSPTWYYTES